ncbi:MAG: fused MFS/spermidine synthase [Wenzhouxiangellaceae bacterium]
MHSRHLFLVALAFVEGAAVMMVELVVARILAPVYGSSLYVWGTVVGITLASLTAGYYLGGWLSRRSARRDLVIWFMLFAAVLIAFLPHLARPLLPAFVSLGTIPAIFLLGTALLAPCLVLLGATTPLIISLLADRIEHAGRAAGLVYGVSTVGGILGTFAAGFYLVPLLGLTITALLAGLLLMALPLADLLGQRRLGAALVPVIVLASLGLQPESEAHPDVEVVYQSEGLLGQLKVIDFTYAPPDRPGRRTDRILFVNRTAQTWIHRDSGDPVWDYMRYIQSVASVLPENSRVLLLGLGGGTIAGQLQQLGLAVDSVELDARIAAVARDYFGLEHSGDVFIDDARHFLRATDRRYDLIVFDVFQAEVPPAHLLTLETFRNIGDRLTSDGFFIVNYSGYLSGSTGRGARSIYRTLVEATSHVLVIPTAEDEHIANNLLIASNHRLDLSDPRHPLTIQGVRQHLPDLALDPGEITLDDALVLRDNQPILEKLNLEAAAGWRKTYYEHFTRPFIEKGVPIFE